MNIYSYSRSFQGTFFKNTILLDDASEVTADAAALRVKAAGASLQEEMAPFVGADWSGDLPPRDAGERLGVRGLGVVEAGAPADILLFRRDPTQAIDHLSSLEAVVAGGRLYRVADLEAALRSSRAYFASPLIKPLARRGAERALARAIGRG